MKKKHFKIISLVIIAVVGGINTLLFTHPEHKNLLLANVEALALNETLPIPDPVVGFRDVNSTEYVYWDAPTRTYVYTYTLTCVGLGASACVRG